MGTWDFLVLILIVLTISNAAGVLYLFAKGGSTGRTGKTGEPGTNGQQGLRGPMGIKGTRGRDYDEGTP